MIPVPVKPYPLERTYASFEAAIAGAEDHPLQPNAQADAKRLEGSMLIDGYWTCTDFVLRFSNDLWLHIFTESRLPRWNLAGQPPSLDVTIIERVGAPPVILDWGDEVGESPMDRSALLLARRGAAFNGLWINECGFWVYTRKHLILGFSVVRRMDTGEDMLCVFEDD